MRPASSPRRPSRWRRTRRSGMAGRQAEGERRAEARGAADVDLAAVLLDDPVDEGESEPGPLRLGGEERLEDVGQVVGPDAFAAVGHRDFQAVTNDLGRDAELAALRHRLEGIQAEVPQHLPELLGVDAPADAGFEIA